MNPSKIHYFSSMRCIDYYFSSGFQCALVRIVFVLAFISSTNTSHGQQTNLVAGIQDLCWAPDSKAIYFSGMWHAPDYSDYKPENWSIYKYDFAGKKTVKFIDSALYVSISSSGKLLATGKMIAGNRDICVYDVDGKNPRILASHSADDYSPSFSPDESKILFNSKRDGKAEIYSVNLDNTEIKRLTEVSKENGNYYPQWSPDGRRIVFYRGTANVTDQLYVMNADGSNPINITNDTLLNYFPGWINNERIIYSRNFKNGKEEIFTISPDGKNRNSLLKIDSFFARVSPNGKLIAYINKKENCITVITRNGLVVNTIRFD